MSTFRDSQTSDVEHQSIGTSVSYLRRCSSAGDTSRLSRGEEWSRRKKTLAEFKAEVGPMFRKQKIAATSCKDVLPSKKRDEGRGEGERTLLGMAEQMSLDELKNDSTLRMEDNADFLSQHSSDTASTLTNSLIDIKPHQRWCSKPYSERGLANASQSRAPTPCSNLTDDRSLTGQVDSVKSFDTYEGNLFPANNSLVTIGSTNDGSFATHGTNETYDGPIFPAQNSLVTIESDSFVNESNSTLATNSGSFNKGDLIIEMSSYNRIQNEHEEKRKGLTVGGNNQGDNKALNLASDSKTQPTSKKVDGSSSGESTTSLDRRRAMAMARSRRKARKRKAMAAIAAHDGMEAKAAENRPRSSSESFGSLTDSDRSLVAGIDTYDDTSIHSKELIAKVKAQGFSVEAPGEVHRGQKQDETVKKCKKEEECASTSNLKEEVSNYGRRETMKTGSSNRRINEPRAAQGADIAMQFKHESLSKPIDKRQSIGMEGMLSTNIGETTADPASNEGIRRMSMVPYTEMTSLTDHQKSTVEEEMVPYGFGHIKFCRRMSVPPSHISEQSNEDEGGDVTEKSESAKPINIKPFAASGRRMSITASPPLSKPISSDQRMSRRQSMPPGTAFVTIADATCALTTDRSANADVTVRDPSDSKPMTEINTLMGRRASMDTQMSELSFEGDGMTGLQQRRMTIGASRSSMEEGSTGRLHPQGKRLSMPLVSDFSTIEEEGEENRREYSQGSSEAISNVSNPLLEPANTSIQSLQCESTFSVGTTGSYETYDGPIFPAQNSLVTIESDSFVNESNSTLATNSGSFNKGDLIIEMSSYNRIQNEHEEKRKGLTVGGNNQGDNKALNLASDSKTQPTSKKVDGSSSGESTTSLDRRRAMAMARSRRKARKRKAMAAIAAHDGMEAKAAENRPRSSSESFGSLTDSDRSLVAGIDTYDDTSIHSKELIAKVKAQGFSVEAPGEVHRGQKQDETVKKCKKEEECASTSNLKEEVSNYGRRETMKTGSSNRRINEPRAAQGADIAMQFKHESLSKPIDKRQSIGMEGMLSTNIGETTADPASNEGIRRMSMVPYTEMTSLTDHQKSTVEEEMVPYGFGHIKFCRRMSVPPSHISEQSNEDEGGDVTEKSESAKPINIKPFAASGRRMSITASPPLSKPISSDQRMSRRQSMPPGTAFVTIADATCALTTDRSANADVTVRDPSDSKPMTEINTLMGRRASMDTQMSELSFEGDGMTGLQQRRMTIGASRSSMEEGSTGRLHPQGKRLSMPLVSDFSTIEEGDGDSTAVSLTLPFLTSASDGNDESAANLIGQDLPADIVATLSPEAPKRALKTTAKIMKRASLDSYISELSFEGKKIGGIGRLRKIGRMVTRRMSIGDFRRPKPSSEVVNSLSSSQRSSSRSGLRRMSIVDLLKHSSSTSDFSGSIASYPMWDKEEVTCLREESFSLPLKPSHPVDGKASTLFQCVSSSEDQDISTARDDAEADPTSNQLFAEENEVGITKIEQFDSREEDEPKGNDSVNIFRIHRHKIGETDALLGEVVRPCEIEIGQSKRSSTSKTDHSSPAKDPLEISYRRGREENLSRVDRGFSRDDSRHRSLSPSLYSEDFQEFVEKARSGTRRTGAVDEIKRKGVSCSHGPISATIRRSDVWDAAVAVNTAELPSIEQGKLTPPPLASILRKSRYSIGASTHGSNTSNARSKSHNSVDFKPPTLHLFERDPDEIIMTRKRRAPRNPSTTGRKQSTSPFAKCEAQGEQT